MYVFYRTVLPTSHVIIVPIRFSIDRQEAVQRCGDGATGLRSQSLSKGHVRQGGDWDSRNLGHTLHIHLRPGIHLPPQRTAGRIHHFAQPVRPAQRLQRLQSMPRIHPDVIFPETLRLPVEAILPGHQQRRDRLPGVFRRVPDFAGVFDRLVVEVLQQLELQQVFGVVVAVEVLEPSGEDIGGVGVGLDGFLVEFLLGGAVGDEAVFGDVVAEAEGGLAVVAGAFEVGVADGVAELLEIRVGAGLEMLVEFGWVIAVFDAQVDDFARGFGVGEIEGEGAIEFDVLGGDADAAGEEVSLNVEDFHCEAPGLGDAIVEAGVAGFGAVTADDGVFGTMVEDALFEMFWEVVMND